jgi:hypothetical protein
MNQQSLKNMFIMTILIIVIIFSLVLVAFNTIEGMTMPFTPKYSFIDNLIK